MPTVPDSGNHGPDWLHDDHEDNHALSTTSADDHSTPEWLKESESSFGSDDVLAKEIQTPSVPATTPGVTPPTITETSSHSADVPDWLKSTDEVSTHTDIAQTSSTNTPAEVPSWLQGNDAPIADEHTEQVVTTPAPAPAIEETKTPTTSSDISHNDVPDWLRGADDGTTTDTLSPDNTVDTAISPVTPKINDEATTDQPHKEESETMSHDIPDWLKGSEMPQSEEIAPSTAAVET